VSLFEAADNWGVFAKDKQSTQIKDLISAGTTSVLDLSVYNSIGAFNIRALVISLISRKIFNQRMDARKKRRSRIYLSKTFIFFAREKRKPFSLAFYRRSSRVPSSRQKNSCNRCLSSIIKRR